jgi:hypothetical protein
MLRDELRQLPAALREELRQAECVLEKVSTVLNQGPLGYPSQARHCAEGLGGEFGVGRVRGFRRGYTRCACLCGNGIHDGQWVDCPRG